MNITEKNSGFSMIELLLTILLCSFLFHFLFEIYLISHRSQRLQNALVNLENKAKTSIHILEHEIKKSGYIGCARLTKDFPVWNEGNYAINPENKLVGNDNSITVRHAGEKNTLLKKTMNHQNILHLGKNIIFKKGDILIISNCQSAEIFIAQNVFSTKKEQNIIPLYPLHCQFEKNAEVSHLEINTFYIAQSKRKDEDGSEIYSLFVENIDRRKTELVDHIKQIHFSYDPPSTIDDWSKVKGVAIAIDIVSSPFKKTWFTYVSLRH